VTRIGELGTTLAATSNYHYLAFLRSVRRLLVAASVVPTSSILVTLMKEALGSSETSVLTRAYVRFEIFLALTMKNSIYLECYAM
jgi:hypothetical protein